MSDVFISYSREDIAFARRLHKALEDNSLEPWIDWRDIPPSTEWLAEIFEAIERANTFVFIISATSVESDTCRLEISHALKNNKRLIPVLIDDTEAEKVAPELASINWLFFRPQEEFDRAFRDLITTLQTDYDWLKQHTRLQIRALEWERKERESGFLLRGRDLVEGEEWLARAAGKDPQPTALQREYIQVSRDSAIRRRRITVGATATAAAIIIAASLTAFFMQRRAHKTETSSRLAQQLFKAVRDGDGDGAEKALKDGADVHARDKQGNTALHLAAAGGNIQLVKLFLGKGMDINVQAGNGWTPMHAAAAGGHIAVAKFLLDKGVHVNVKAKDGTAPIHVAAAMGQVEMVKFIMDKGVDVNARDEKGAAPIHLAAWGGQPEMMEFLLERGADVNARDSGGATPLHNAAGGGQVNTARFLLERGADLGARDNNGWTPMHLAAGGGQVAMAAFLLDKGAGVNVQSNDGATPLHVAAAGGLIEMADFLLGRGADVNVRAGGGWTPLHLAATHGQIEMARFLLGRGADVNARGDNGATPMRLALDTAKDSQGNLSAAEIAQIKKTAELLKQNGGLP